MNLEEKIKNIMADDFAIKLETSFNDVTIEINGNQSVNPASIIKLSILYAALIKVDQKKINLNDVVEYSDSDLVPGCGVLKLLKQRFMTLNDLLHLMITVSDNSATNILIDQLGLPYIQSTIEALGLKQTYVRRKLYHLIPGVFNSSSVNDTNILLKAFDSGTGLSQEMQALSMSILSKQQYQNFVRDIKICSTCGEIFKGNYCTCGVFSGTNDPEKLEIYSKSGEITGHVHDAAIIVYKGLKVYVSLFTYNQIDNGVIKNKLAEVGVLIYKYLKEQSC